MEKKALSRVFLWLIGMVLSMGMLSACYEKPRPNEISFKILSQEVTDSLHFYAKHHYGSNYNFVVKTDSLVLFCQQPEEIVSGLSIDSFAVKRNNHVVVADIRVIPVDSVDSVWIQLATDQHDFGWIHEKNMLKKVVPDDPISQFISTFSDIHLLIFLIIISLIAVVYWVHRVQKAHAYIVHFRDIHSFYPTLLCLIVAASSTFYASIQMFVPELWKHFYYHPTLNPFSVPLPLSIFLISVWAMIIVGLAVIDDIRHRLPFGEAVMYLGGVVAMCAVNYIVFGLTTLYYIGYPLLLLYFFFALKQYFKHSFVQLSCGKCGEAIASKGKCPHCGTMNV